MRNARRLLSYVGIRHVGANQRRARSDGPRSRRPTSPRPLYQHWPRPPVRWRESDARSTLATAIAAILSGGRRQTKVAYRGGSAPYTPAEEQAFLLLARHQPTLIKRARLATVIALGAGAERFK